VTGEPRVFERGYHPGMSAYSNLKRDLSALLRTADHPWYAHPECALTYGALQPVSAETVIHKHADAQLVRWAKANRIPIAGLTSTLYWGLREGWLAQTPTGPLLQISLVESDAPAPAPAPPAPPAVRPAAWQGRGRSPARLQIAAPPRKGRGPAGARAKGPPPRRSPSPDP
jgi:hypothetical protein